MKKQAKKSMKKKLKPLKNKPDLVRELAKKTNITQKLAKIYIETILNELKEAFIENKRIEIRGLGSFKVKKQKALKGIHPITKKKISVPEKKKIAFKSHLSFF